MLFVIAESTKIKVKLMIWLLLIWLNIVICRLSMIFCSILNYNIKLINNIKKLITVQALKNEFNDKFDVTMNKKNAKQCLISFNNNNLKRFVFDINNSNNNNNILFWLENCDLKLKKLILYLITFRSNRCKTKYNFVRLIFHSIEKSNILTKLYLMFFTIDLVVVDYNQLIITKLRLLRIWSINFLMNKQFFFKYILS